METKSNESEDHDKGVVNAKKTLCRSRNNHSVSSLPMAPTIDDFQILKPISRGAFGKVFLGCRKSKPDKLYAIKVMRKSEVVAKNMSSQVK